MTPSPAANPPADHLGVLSAIDLRGPELVDRKGVVKVTACRGEWVSVLLRIDSASAGGATSLTLPDWANGPDASHAKIDAFQVLPVPLDINRAGYLRQTGQPASAQALPRALLPVAVANGRIDLSQLRDPRTPAVRSPGLASRQPLLVWLDVFIPIDTTPGTYVSAATLNTATTPLAGVRLDLQIYDFVLPDDRKLNVVAEVSWESLLKHWPDLFEVAEPQLLSRGDNNRKSAVALLDEMMTLAEANRAQLHISRLQPVVKWPSGQPVRVDWNDYDALVTPWLSGSLFADKVPMGSWQLPRIDYLDNIPAAARLEYYASAAGHFDQKDWLRYSPVLLEKPTPGRATLADRVLLSAEASRVLRAHPRVRVAVPMELDEVQLATDANTNLIDRTSTGRLDCVAPGLISSSPLNKWPADLDRPRGWLRTDVPGLIPYVGAGGQESDVRVWAWVAYLRHANLISWGDCLPGEPDLQTPADPNRLVWFYPGQWFGVDHLVPTIQLKWLRRAEQDFEYLSLADTRGSRITVLPMARVLSRPVEIQPGQQPDPVYSLLIGTADAAAWAEVKGLLADIILARGPGITEDPNTISKIDLGTLDWMQPLEKPVILARTTQWSVGTPPPGGIGPWVNLRLGIDLYNASDTTPNANELTFDRPVPGWQIEFQPVPIPQLLTYQVVRQGLNARIDPGRVTGGVHKPVRILYRSGFDGATTPLELVAPVARTVRRATTPKINGSLDDWVGDDALQLGPLVKFMSRPGVQSHTIEYAKETSDLYSGWGAEDFYFAFRVEGISQASGVLSGRNFIDYQNDRAWGEDVCQAVIQAVYDDGTTGPLVHVAVKPGGNLWVERHGDPRVSVNTWQPFESGVRYAATADGNIWRGEIAVPWSALIDASKTDDFARQARPNLPTMLKFNFIQHRRDTGDSTSWAGPIDVGRSDAFTGVLVLKEPE